MQVKKLFRLCPARPSSSSSNDVFILDQRGIDAIIALELFELKSNLQWKDKLMPYLVDVLHGLPYAKWVEAREPLQTAKMPMTEEFSLCFISLINGLVQKDSSLMKEIVQEQITVFNVLTEQCNAFRELSDFKKGLKTLN